MCVVAGDAENLGMLLAFKLFKYVDEGLLYPTDQIPPRYLRTQLRGLHHYGTSAQGKYHDYDTFSI